MRRRGAVAGAPTAPAAHADANLGPIVRARDKDGRVWPRNPHQLSAGDGGGRRRRRLITTYSSAPRAPVPEWPRDAAAAAAAAARRRVSFSCFFFNFFFPFLRPFFVSLLMISSWSRSRNSEGDLTRPRLWPFQNIVLAKF